MGEDARPARAGVRDRAPRADARVLTKLHVRVGALTPGERDVMGLVVSERLNNQIASDLHLSEARVKTLRCKFEPPQLGRDGHRVARVVMVV